LSFRAVILGLLLALTVCVCTYFNDQVIRQTMLIGNLFPVVVFGVVVLVLIVINPLLRVRALRGPEIALITAMGLAACGWPGSNFFRVFTPALARPGELLKDNPAWQAVNVMSYIPGGAAEIGAAHVTDWPGLVQKLRQGAQPDAPDDLRCIWEQLPDDVHGILEAATDQSRVPPFERARILTVLNNLIDDDSLYRQPAFAAITLPEPAEDLRRQRQEYEAAAEQWLEQIQPLRAERDQVRLRDRSQREQLEDQMNQVEQRRDQWTLEQQQLGDQRLQLRLDNEQLSFEVISLQRRLQGAGEQNAPNPQTSPLTEQIQQLQQQIKDQQVQSDDLQKQINDLNSQIRTDNKSLTSIGKQLQRVDRPASQLEHQTKLIELKIEHCRGRIVHVDRHLNRLLMLGCFPDMLAPPPPGDGWLVNGGQIDPFATETLGQGWSGQLNLKITELPWDIWAPTLKLWVTVALLFGLAALFMTLVVHPQWSRRELLAYPIARFVQEIAERSPGRRLPVVAQSKLFWLAMGAVLVIHIINGLNTWFPQFIRIPVEYNFYPLRVLFEKATLAPQTWAVYFPHVYFCVVGFAFFLRTEVSLSLGLVGVAYMILAQVCYGYSTPIDHDWFTPGNFSLLLFGAWLGGAIIVLYVGRRYYLNVLGAAAGLKRQIDTPSYAIWATRGLIACIFGATWMLTHAGLDWGLSVLFVGLVLLMFLMIARIAAETGFFFIQPGWLPAGVLTAVLGPQALGPTAYLLLAIASIIIMVDPREALIPYLVNGLQMTDRTNTPPRRSAPWLAVVIVGGFFVALGVTLLLQYNIGLNLSEEWATKTQPSAPYLNVTRLIGELSGREQLTEANTLSGLARFAEVRPKGTDIAWISLGAALVVGCALARLRLAWWPIHPVIFMVFGSVSAMRFAWAFIIGWAIKASVVRLGGSRSYRSVRPLMVGMIAGEIFAALIWTIVGAIYYWVTDGGIPKQYQIFPP